MKHFSKAMSALFLSVILLASCKKNQVEQVEADGSVKNGGKTSARNIYVSANFGNDATTNPHSTSTPFKTLQAASDITIPGDIVYVMNGTYEPPKKADGVTLTDDPNDITLKITRSGSASGGYITYKKYPGASPVIYTYGKKWGTIIVNANYIVLDGLEVKGANNNTPGGSFLTAALAAEREYRAGGRDYTKLSQFNTNGIQVGESGTPHHISISNCQVHDFPGGGIAVFKTDYLTVQGNTSYNNCWFGMYGGSGIGVIFNTNSDNNTSIYKTVVQRNICHNNYPQVPYYDNPRSELSDGNGIIIDINYATSETPDYTGKTLVENNICYQNGGGGVHVYRAQNVEVYNNTTYKNETKLPYGNIDATNARNVKFRNNIAYAETGKKAMGGASVERNITFDYNVYYNGTVTNGGDNSKTQDPLFVDRLARNFRLQSTSPAINAGTPTSLSGTTKDIEWDTRFQGGRIDAGAYEVR